MTEEKRIHEPTCRSCKIRMRKAPLARDSYNPMLLNRRQVQWLENAARVFDADSEELWTAEEFVSWLKPDLTGKYPPIPPDMAGLSIKEGGSRNGTGATRHGSADPIPFAPMPSRMRRVGR